MKKLPKKLRMVAELFGDGARGYRLQQFANREFDVYCVAVRENRDSDFVHTWGSELTGDEEFSSYADLRDAYNELIKK